ncbi:MAG: asparagine synthase (glutamine-hydrolyzing) [Alphaproteobacteria bacterium]|nr:asparagine synthase (glutamine-hydrolyzing) [Alphaproteobacteria bacterium]
MCGIAGFSGTSPAPGLLETMRDLVSHRGPDGAGCYVSADGQMNLAHRRLSIIDLETGAQPMHNEDASVWIVFNGEIYNYLELRDGLIKSGRHQLASHSDTEVLLHLYEEHGVDFLSRLNGMFSLALWDEGKKRLVLARDRLGVKPLYWTQTGDGRIVFGSEIKSLLCWPGHQRKTNEEALSHYLTLRYVPEPMTIYQGIHALQAAHVMVWEQGRDPSIQKYWSLDFSHPSSLDENTLCDQLEALILDATRVRLRSDVPVGAYLSGGIDSSLVVAMMRKLNSGHLHTFVMGYADQPADKQDIHFAQLLARKFETEHHEHIVSANDLAASLPKIAKYFDQPFSGAVSTYFLTDYVKEHVKVVLTGDGADDQFASYGHHRLIWPLSNLAKARAAGYADPYAVADLAPFADRPDYLRTFEGLAPWQVRARFGAFAQPDKRRLLDTPAGRSAAKTDTAEYLHQLFKKSMATDDLNALLDLDIQTSLPGEVLAFCDRLSMAHGVEARSPFLDYRIAEFAASIPGRLKIKGSVLKYLLRLVAARHLPREIIERPKEGFVQPNHVWLCGQLDTALEDLLSPAALAVHGLFDRAYIAQILEEHQRGKADHAFRIFTLMMFQTWHRTYMEKPAWPPQATACA